MSEKNVKNQHPESSTGAKREGIGLPYLSQVPLEAVAAGAVALEYGSFKYGDRNWERGLPWQQMIDSLRRHIDDFERRKDNDDGVNGSGLPHVCLIMSSAMMLTTSVIRGIGEDDRIIQPDENSLTGKEIALWMKEVLQESNIDEL